MPDMTCAFLDESPCLADPMNYFVIGILVPGNLDGRALARIKRIPKKVRQQNLKNKVKKKIPELKFSNAQPHIREKVLRLLAAEDIKVFIYVLDKEGARVRDDITNYSIVTGNAISCCMQEASLQLDLTVDKKYTKKTDRKFFDDTVKRIVSRDHDGFSLEIKHAESHRDNLTQLVDFVAGAVNYKYNGEESSYFEIVKDKVVFEDTVKWSQLKGEDWEIFQ